MVVTYPTVDGYRTVPVEPDRIEDRKVDQTEPLGED